MSSLWHRQFDKVRSTAGSLRRRAAARKANRVRLLMEPLEERMVLSSFTPGDIVVYRVGDATTKSGSSNATNVYLDEYTPQGVLVQSIPLSSLATASNASLYYEDSAKASNDGSMTLGPNGLNLASVGYDVAPGTASVTKGNPTGTVAVVGENGVPTFSTNQNDNTGSSSIGMNNRSATYDSTTGSLYETGVAGLFEAPLSSATSQPGAWSSISGTAQPTTAEISYDEVSVFGGHLFADSGAGIVDFGTEPTGSTTGIVLPGVDTTKVSVSAGTAGSYTDGSPSNFFFANLGSGNSWNGTGDDTLYVTDNETGGGAILKFSYSGTGTTGTWTSDGAIKAPTATDTNAYVMGLTGTVSGGVATLYFDEGDQGSGAETALFSLTDSGQTNEIYNDTVQSISINAPGTGSTTTANSTTYESFKGLAFAPAASALALGGLNGANYTQNSPTATILTGGNGTFADTLTSSQLNTSTLSVSVTGGDSNDVLAIQNQGTGLDQVGASSGTLTYTYQLNDGATTIGTYSGGTNGTPLTITFNGNATAAAVQAVYNQITFSTSSSSTATRTVTFTLTPSAGNGSAVSTSESVNILPKGTPFVGAGHSVTLGENHTAYSTQITGIGDGESDNNADVSLSAAVTSGSSSLFTGTPTVTGFNASTGTANLNFTPAANASGTATITVTVTNTSNGLTATATFPVTINPITVTSEPVYVATGIYANGDAVDITTSQMNAIENGVQPVNMTFTLTSTPANGTLYDNGNPLYNGSTFSGSDLGNGYLYFVATGSSSATTTINYNLSENINGGSLTGQSLTINIIKPKAFQPGDLVVERLGDQGILGGASTATPVWIDEYTTTGTLVQSIPLPDSTKNGDLAFTDSGKASSNGQLALGPDGQTLALYGYDLDADIGNATGAASETTVALVGTNGVVKTEGFENNADDNARSAVYDTLTGNLYLSGANGTATDTFTANAVGQTATSVQGHSAGFTDIFNGDIYFANINSNGGLTSGIYSLGSESSPTAPAPLQGADPVTGSSVNLSSSSTYAAGTPLAFYFAKLPGNSNSYNGYNTLYVADDNSASGAVLKYSYNGTSWVSEGAISGPNTGTSSQIVGLTGAVEDGVATLYISVGNTGAGATAQLYAITDASGSTGTLYNGSTPGSLGSPIVNVNDAVTPSTSAYENFRGVQFVPGTPSWLAAGSQAYWDSGTQTLTVVGNATIDADPGAASPLIVGTSSADHLTIAPTTVGEVNLGGIELNGGATISVPSVNSYVNNLNTTGSANVRTHDNHNVIVLDSTTVSPVAPFSINYSNGSTMDLADNDMIIQNGGNTDPVDPSESDLTAVEAAAYNARDVAAGGGADGLGGAWDMAGLTSSAAEAAYNANGYEYTTLGIALNNNLPLGAYASWQAGTSTLTLGGNDVIVKYTYNGDFTLEGQVGGDDATIFTAFYGTVGLNPQDSFDEGDTNGDGSVDGADATIFTINYGAGFGGNSGEQL